MGKRKLTKKLNKKRIVKQRAKPKVVKKHPAPQDPTKPNGISNEMLKVMLSKQQPTIPTQDPNMLATNRKFDQMDEKHRKQLEALQAVILNKERELLNVQGDRVHQEQLLNLTKQKDNMQKQIDANKQQIKDNTRYQDVEDKKKELDKVNAELIAVQAVVNSKDFQQPKEALVRAAAELEAKNQELKDMRAIKELMDERRKQEDILLGMEQANKDRFKVKKPRYDERFIKRDAQGNPIKHYLKKEEYGTLPMYTVDGRKAHGVVYDETSGHYKDKRNNAVYSYEYENNMKTDHEMYQIQFQEQEKANRAIKQKQEMAQYEAEQYDKLESDIRKQHIDNNITKIKTKTIENANKLYQDGGEARKKLLQNYETIAYNKAMADSECKNQEELNQALTSEIEEQKKKLYLQEMKRIQETTAFKQQQDEITKTKIMTDAINKANEAMQQQTLANQRLFEIRQAEELRKIYVGHAGEVNPEDMVNFVNQEAEKRYKLIQDKPKFDAWALYKSKFQRFTNEQQKTNSYNTLQSLGIDPETLENETATTEQYKYAANIVDPVWEWSTNQNDTRDFEAFVQSLTG